MKTMNGISAGIHTQLEIHSRTSAVAVRPDGLSARLQDRVSQNEPRHSSSGVVHRIHPTGLRGWRLATSAPVRASAANATSSNKASGTPPPLTWASAADETAAGS